MGREGKEKEGGRAKDVKIGPPRGGGTAREEGKEGGREDGAEEKTRGGWGRLTG
jgi:hypothetical protein